MTNKGDVRDFVMKGGWFALEQAGRLLSDARLLFEAGVYSTAAGLALLSREELAKSRTLFALWMRVNRGEALTRKQVVRSIGGMRHVDKQRQGASMFSIPVDKSTMEMITQPGEVPPDKYAKTRQRLDQMFQAIMKRAPADRHELRLRAFYVDAAKAGDTWLRPIDIT